VTTVRKRISLLLAILVLGTAMFAACGKQKAGNNLFDAIADHGAIHFYIYDGETTRSSWVLGESRAQLLEMLVSTPVTRDAAWTNDDLTLPICGFSASKQNGQQFFIAFSGGRAITQDGVAYFCDLDPAAIEADYAWDEDWFEAEAAAFPCDRLLLLHGDAWRTDLMRPAPAHTAPDGITAELVEWNGGNAVVTFRNNSAADWNFGADFGVEVCIDGIWYPIPTRMSEYALAFPAIGYVVSAGGTWKETYAISAHYGGIPALPAGQYRLVAYGLTVEFRVK